VKDRVTELARNVLGPELNGLRFRRRRRIFWRERSDVCQVVALVMSPWGTRTSSSFDVFLGVYWHDVEKLQRKASSSRKMPPPHYECTFSIDLGWTTPRRLQKSWDINQKTNLANLGHELLSDLLKYGLPWLEYRSTLRHALERHRYLRPEGHSL